MTFYAAEQDYGNNILERQVFARSAVATPACPVGRLSSSFSNSIEQPRPSYPFSKREGTALLIFSKLFVLPHQLKIFNHHLSTISNIIKIFVKLALCVCKFPPWGS